MRVIKIKIEIVDSPEEESLHLKIEHMDETVTKLVNALKVKGDFIFGDKDDTAHRVLLKDVYYFEALEKKVFLYTKNEVYEIKERLYQIEEKYQDLDFVRISKSVIVNIDRIQEIYPVLSGRFELKMDNNEVLQISRYYVNNLKRKLGMEG